MKNTAAFFDIDGTIFRNSLMIEHFIKLINFEVIDPEIWYTKVKKVYDEWEKRHGDFEQYLETLAGVYLENLKGVNKLYIEFIADHVINVNGDMVYKYSRNQIEWHKKQGHKVFFISGSPDFLVSKMAEKYGATEFRGTLYLVDEDNKFTGEIVKMWDSESKKRVIKELIKKYDVDLENSYAYGDTTGDLSMLRMMGNPIAINPNRLLLESIREDKKLSERAIIIVERKDVIYKLDPNVEVL
ncbi:HAD family hydrolase [Paratissierella segnis]|uniref:phosphoserine phosphatase n=1 Tax=Paratissierella segnis TaxID=2763679 RepID=A0A926EZF6_9FIRM|nr:HAD-IB family hydrolase [Paratissierella segnis]MBC8589219.1 HAD-IB family hydrolase [Paratissierella segnis]